VIKFLIKLILIGVLAFCIHAYVQGQFNLQTTFKIQDKVYQLQTVGSVQQVPPPKIKFKRA